MAVTGEGRSGRRALVTGGSRGAARETDCPAPSA